MKLLKLLVQSCLFLMAVILLVGCEKNDPVIEDTKTPTVNLESEINYDTISDEEFQQRIEGFVTVPDDIYISDKVKNLILEDFTDQNPELLKAKGYSMIYTKEDILFLEKEGLTTEEGNIKVLEELGVSPNQSEEQIIEQLRRSNSTQSRSSSNVGLIYVPHYYEWDSTENPNGYNWCGHASLKGVAKKHGAFKTLGQIHTAFWNNSPAYRNDRCNDNEYCASLSDLLYASNNANGGSWNYDYPSSSLESINSKAHFFQRVRDGVNYNKPLIMPSFYSYSYGHFYAVVGYQVRYSNGNINYSTSKVYLRDVADSTPGIFYDKTASVSSFYNHRNGNQVLFVRP